MNMLEGRVDPDDAERFLTGDGIALPLDRPAAAAAKPAIYGLRPEAMHLGGDIPLTIEVVEPTGSETHVVGRIGATPVVGVFRERIAAGPGESLSLIHI